MCGSGCSEVGPWECGEWGGLPKVSGYSNCKNAPDLCAWLYAFYLGMRWLFLQRALQLVKHFHIHEPTEHSVTTTRSKVTADGEPPSANGLREAGPGGE